MLTKKGHMKWGIYFSWVALLGVYGMEWSLDYWITLCITNMYYTLGEYLFHRYTFHSPERFPKITRLHQKHHDVPSHPDRLFIPISITFVNDMVLGMVVYLLGGSVFKWLSSAHVSYLLFEYAHYGTHSSRFQTLLPRRLIAFHHYHHEDATCHYAFTTPYWDILFGTVPSSNRFSFYEYPLAWLPFSVLSFLSTDELQVVTNLVYLWPAMESWKRGWMYSTWIYAATGCVSAMYHTKDSHSIWKIMDYGFAISYLIVSVFHWWNTIYLSSYLVIASCILSIILFCLDHSAKSSKLYHIAWHLTTGMGVGYMLSLVDTHTPAF